MGTLILVLINFTFIGALPRIFFRADGRFNARWWMTAAPLFAAPISLVAMRAGFLEPTWSSLWQEIASVLLSVASIALMTFTLGTHRIPISLWHQENDDPRSIVTWGAYKRIRHPFYASFIVALSSALVFAPHALTAASWLAGFAVLNMTAAREEKRLSASQFGSEYVSYMSKTGRFLPRFGANA
jgi:protein-S-isoprenylcysteine O-methyltransferase Ste14